jgi:ATPase subunit of ABC transporter with duplicated ATPase domains
VQINVRATSLRVADVSFKLRNEKEISVSGSNTNGHVTQFKLKTDEHVIGCYGFLSGN